MQAAAASTPTPAQQQHAWQALQVAIRVVFGQWTALRLAVENEFAGHATRDKALTLLERVSSGMLGASHQIYVDEIETLLEEVRHSLHPPTSQPARRPKKSTSAEHV
tara:strand:- start:2284 stop:2604 length:321 start_codon:yes stop_codon:yes gene_type:complete